MVVWPRLFGMFTSILREMISNFDDYVNICFLKDA